MFILDQQPFKKLEVKQILKWRDIYDDLEQATDRAEDAGDILEGIVLKHS